MSTQKEVTFASRGVKCAARLYEPSKWGPESTRVINYPPAPCVVMVHGLGGTMDLALPAFAKRFAAADMAVLVFDYAYFGKSEGQPRQLVDIGHQLDDCRAAIAFARVQAKIVDSARIALWGTSLGGGHVIALAADDPQIAAVVSQIPFAGFQLHRHGENSTKLTLQLAAAAADDTARGWLGRRPHKIPLVGKPGETALFTDPRDEAIMAPLIATAPEFQNALAPRKLFPLARYRPGAHAARLDMPVLFCLAEHDTVGGTAALVTDMVARAPRAQVHRYPIRHFEAYVGDWFERIVPDQTAFLQAHLGLNADQRGHDGQPSH